MTTFRCDWDKVAGRFQVYAGRPAKLVGKWSRVEFHVPAALVAVDGGRHGYLVASGQLVEKSADRVAIVPTSEAD